MTYDKFLEDEILFSDDVSEKCPAASLAAEIIMLIKSIDDEVVLQNYTFLYNGGNRIEKEVITTEPGWLCGDCKNCPHNCEDGYNGDYCGLPEVEPNECAEDDGASEGYGERCPYHKWVEDLQVVKTIWEEIPIYYNKDTAFHAQMTYQEYFMLRIDSRNAGNSVEVKVRTKSGMLLLHYMADAEDSDDDVIIECQHDWFIDAIIDKISHRWDD